MALVRLTRFALRSDAASALARVGPIGPPVTVTVANDPNVQDMRRIEAAAVELIGGVPDGYTSGWEGGEFVHVLHRLDDRAPGGIGYCVELTVVTPPTAKA